MLQCKILYTFQFQVNGIILVATCNVVNKFLNCYFIHVSKAIHVYKPSSCISVGCGVSEELPPGTTAYCDLHTEKLPLAPSVLVMPSLCDE